MSAPADEYFGRLKLSNLGIRTIVRDIGIEGDSPLALPAQQERIREGHAALFAWAKKYPRDPWLPGTMYSFARMTLNKHQAWMDAQAIATLYFVLGRYPGSEGARRAAALLAEYPQTPPWDVDTLYDLTNTTAAGRLNVVGPSKMAPH